MTHDPEPGPAWRHSWQWPLKIMVIWGAAGVVIISGSLLLGSAISHTGWLISLAYGGAVWLAAVMCVTAVVLAVRTGERRIRVALLVAAAMVVVGGLPTLTYAAIAVDHGPAGAGCDTCAVLFYVNLGPWTGKAADDPEFDRLLCGGHRDELRAQAVGIAWDVDAADWSRGVLVRGSPTDETVTRHGDTATVIAHVELSYQTGTGRQASFDNVDTGVWAFTLTHTDGWQVCGVDAPNLASG